MQILSIIRRHAKHKNHNSCMYSFEVIPFQTLLNSSYIYLTPLEMQVQHFMYLHVYVPYLLLSLYPFAVPKPDFLYKTASLH